MAAGENGLHEGRYLIEEQASYMGTGISHRRRQDKEFEDFGQEPRSGLEKGLESECHIEASIMLWHRKRLGTGKVGLIRAIKQK